MNKFLLIFLVLSFNEYLMSVGLSYPSYLKKCEMMDEGCLKTAISDILKNYSPVGIKDINLKVLDPLYIDIIRSRDISNEFQNFLTADMNSTDNYMRGLHKAVCVKAEFERRKDAIKGTFHLQMPRMTLEGDYKINGSVLETFPIQGDGDYDIWMSDPLLQIKFIGKMSKIGNDYFYNINKFQSKYNLTRGGVNMRNLFNGDEQLGKTVNEFINNNWKEIFDRFNRPLFDVFTRVIQSSVKDVFKVMPLNELFTNFVY